MSGRNRLLHPMADIIRNLADKRIIAAEGGYEEEVLLTTEEKNAILWAATLLDDSNRNLVIGKREG